jgi:hypothetical protein
VVVSVAGGLQLSRKLARGAASLQQLEDAFRAGGFPSRAGSSRGEGRIRGPRRAPARLLSRSRRLMSIAPEPGGPYRQDLRVPHHRIQGRRKASSSRGVRFSRKSREGARR